MFATQMINVGKSTTDFEGSALYENDIPIMIWTNQTLTDGEIININGEYNVIVNESILDKSDPDLWNFFIAEWYDKDALTYNNNTNDEPTYRVDNVLFGRPSALGTNLPSTRLYYIISIHEELHPFFPDGEPLLQYGELIVEDSPMSSHEIWSINNRPIADRSFNWHMVSLTQE